MARNIRIEEIGYHYIMNRSVELRNIFIVEEDYNKFITIISSLSNSHDFIVHSYSLLPHAYYLFIETKKKNIAMIMKILNSSYANYFNRKYGRIGHLWEGRYKSSFMKNTNYIFYFIRYIEYLPLLSGITLNLEGYNYSTYRQFIGVTQRLKIVEESIIFKKFNTIEEIKNFFLESIDKESIDNLIEILRKKKIAIKVESKKRKVEEYFFSSKNKEDEDKSIFIAYKAGVSQSKIANFLGVTQQAVSLKIKAYQLEKIN